MRILKRAMVEIEEEAKFLLTVDFWHDMKPVIISFYEYVPFRKKQERLRTDR